MNEMRRDVWNAARQQKLHALAREIKGARFVLWKRVEDMTERQRARLATIAETNKPLYRVYLLKEQLRQVFQMRGQEAIAMLDDWLIWARRSQLHSFIHPAHTIGDYRTGIEATLTRGPSNARVEPVNTGLRLLARIAFGFRSVEALIALAMLTLGQKNAISSPVLKR